MASASMFSSANPYQKEFKVNSISPASHLILLKQKINKADKMTIVIKAVVHDDVKKILPKIDKKLLNEEAEPVVCCSICQCSVHLPSDEAKSAKSLPRVLIDKEDMAYKAYGKWIHRECKKLMKEYEDKIFKSIHANKIEKQQRAYELAFRVFEKVLKPVPIAFILRENDSQLPRIQEALARALSTVEAVANFESRVCTKNA